MKRTLPSLKALRAFDAAARHLSCTQAAQELSVSQSAVSHQVRLLEESLGVRLFHRQGRKLILSASGRDLVAVLGPCFDQLESIAGEIRSAQSREVVNVSLSYPIGVAWLSRYIGAFGRLNPSVEVNLNFSWALVDFEKEEFDFAIRWGRGDWPRTQAKVLLPGHMVPMCAPDYLPTDEPLEFQDKALSESLLHLESFHYWTRWLQAAGLDPVLGQRGALLGDAMNLISAAVEGDGVIIMWLPLAIKELQSGALIIPSRIAIDKDCHFWLVSHKKRHFHAMAKELVEFLESAASKDRNFLDRY